jgi:uncharacterized protein YigA (DUF484 family)
VGEAKHTTAVYDRLVISLYGDYARLVKELQIKLARSRTVDVVKLALECLRKQVEQGSYIISAFGEK